MSSNIEVYEDENLSLDFELKSYGVWLYVHESHGEEQLDWFSAHTKKLTVQDIDQMIAAFQDAREFIERMEGTHNGRTTESDTRE